MTCQKISACVLQSLNRCVMGLLVFDRRDVDLSCDRTDVSLKVSEIATPSASFVPEKCMAVFYQIQNTFISKHIY